ncbi:MAG: hypothetical protein HUU38_07260 [Anaerolineales bacterium]|nr:hypothetical protein [Anaerolineales bacterium]
MEDEIDLQKYILLLIKNWGWIIGLSVLFALGAFLISKFVLSPTYESKALVLIVPSRYSLTFDPKFQTESTSELLYFRPTAQLAESDATMQALHEAWVNNGGKADTTIAALEAMTKVELDTASNSMLLFVENEDPEVATEIVNLWATILVQKANNLFGENIDGEDSLEAQFVQIQAEREAAQQALVEFESQNEASIMTTRVTVQQTLYGQILADHGKLTQVLQDLETLQAQLDSQPANQPVSPETEFTALLLQLKAYNLDLTLPQLQLSAQTSETPRTVGTLATQMAQLQEVLELRATNLALQLDPLQTEILQLQSQIKDLQATGEQLQQNYQVTSDTYLTLARKLTENEISSEVSGNIVKLGSRAIVPMEPVGPRTLINILIGGVSGLILSISFIFARDFWASVPEEEKPFQHAPKNS